MAGIIQFGNSRTSKSKENYKIDLMTAKLQEKALI